MIRVKILVCLTDPNKLAAVALTGAGPQFNKKSSALVEFATAQQAWVAISASLSDDSHGWVWVCCRRASCAEHLKDCPFYGQNLHVVPSSRPPSFPEMPGTVSNFALRPEHQSVGMPRPDSDPTSLALTSDYTGSPLHRFGVGSKHAMV